MFDVHFTSKDVINRANKINLLFESDKKNIEVFLEEVKNGGGKVLAKYHEGNHRIQSFIYDIVHPRTGGGQVNVDCILCPILVVESTVFLNKSCTVVDRLLGQKKL